jgi:hypothetical protein
MTPNPSTQKQTTSWKLIRFLLLFSIPGIALGWLYYSLNDMGVFERWHYVMQVPYQNAEVLGGYALSGNMVYLRTADQKVVSCQMKTGSQVSCIPDVLWDETRTEPCEARWAAFVSFGNAPKEMTSCLLTNGFGSAESAYQVLYALDRKGGVWQWMTWESAFEIIGLPIDAVAGALVGACIGSLVWAAKGYFSQKSRPTPGEKKLNTSLTLLAIPWLCSLTAMLAWFGSTYRPPDHSGPNASDYARWTAVAGTDTAQMREESGQWPVQVTPGSSIYKYDLAQNMCLATWTSGWKDLPVACQDTPSTAELAVSKLLDATIAGERLEGNAIGMHLGGDSDRIRGDFPAMQINAGDHLRTTVGCLETSPNCEGIFEIGYKSVEEGEVTLGRWRLTPDGQREDIELDRSQLSGKFIRVYLYVIQTQPGSGDQNLVWVNPRIEP